MGMRFWFARDSEVSIREQLVTQIMLGIVSGELAAGQRLPSTRELARRFDLHPNTISAGYRQLENEGWVEFRHGSGVYVRDAKPEAASSKAVALDGLVAGFLGAAREMGVPLAELRARVERWVTLQPPDHILVVEPDEELRKIVMAETAQCVSIAVCGCDPKGLRESNALVGALPVVLPSKKELVRRELPAGAELIVLKVRSVPSSLANYLPARTDLLIGVASRWPEFLRSSKTMLVAAGFHPDSLVIRDARKAGWAQGLKQTAAVVCDCLTATKLSNGCRAIPFSIVAEESIAELRSYFEFLETPTK